jgi:hypothetical protein
MSTDNNFRAADGLPPRPLHDESIRAVGSGPPPRGGGESPAATQQFAFVGRLRQLLQMHNELAKTQKNPAMWSVVQGVFLFLAIAVGFGVFQSMIMANPQDNSATIAFIITFVVIAAGPDFMLYLARRARKKIARVSIEEFIAGTVRSYPDEVEECGGIKVLVDRVELEALVHVLHDRMAGPG